MGKRYLTLNGCIVVGSNPTLTTRSCLYFINTTNIIKRRLILLGTPALVWRSQIKDSQQVRVDDIPIIKL